VEIKTRPGAGVMRQHRPGGAPPGHTDAKHRPCPWSASVSRAGVSWEMGQEANGALRHNADRGCATRRFSRAAVAGKRSSACGSGILWPRVSSRAGPGRPLRTAAATAWCSVAAADSGGHSMVLGSRCGQRRHSRPAGGVLLDTASANARFLGPAIAPDSEHTCVLATHRFLVLRLKRWRG
jgi:hypothetical protein